MGKIKIPKKLVDRIRKLNFVVEEFVEEAIKEKLEKT